MDSERFRLRVTHGWEWFTLSEEDQDNIVMYIATGDPDFLPERFRIIRDGMVNLGQHADDSTI